MPEEHHYNKNFLTKVIFRMDYPLNLELERERPIELQKKIRENFPILEPLEQIGITFRRIPGVSDDTDQLAKTIWKFFSSDKKQEVEVDSNYLSVSFNDNSYKHYSDFKETVEHIVNSFCEIYPTTIINRLGLRYINEIKVDDDNLFDWSDYINQDLIKNLDFYEDKEKIVRAMNSNVIKIDEASFMNFKYGIFNPGFPGEIVEKSFILDFDCYTKEELNQSDLFDKLDSYNLIMYEYFEKSIEQKTRDLLNRE